MTQPCTIYMDDEALSDDGKLLSPFGSAFRMFDSKDYSNIGMDNNKEPDSFITVL